MPRRALLLLSCLVPALGARAQQADAFESAKRTFLANDVSAAYAMFAAAVRARPDDAGRRAWYADAARRLGEATTALSEAREALRLDPCHGQAHEVLANLHNPQFQHLEVTSDDSTMAHLREAVRCAPDEGAAWMSLWVQSFRLASADEERRALEGLKRSGMLTPAWLAHGSWMLRAAPPRAIVLSVGDVDTYPAAIAQGVDRLRPDVALVNTSMLNLGYVVTHLQRRHGLPLPPDLPRDSLEYAGERIVRYWRQEAAAGRLDRPLVILHTAGADYAAQGPGVPKLAGPYWIISPPGDGAAARMDEPAIARALELADPAAFSGPFVSPKDRSPIRVSAAFPPAIMVGELLRMEAEARGTLRPDRLRWLEDFFRRAEVPADRAEGYLSRLRSLTFE
jgi:tetratricopeptide (TPR) repeat protein